MNKRIEAKSVSGKSVTGFAGVFQYDMFAPDTVTVIFPHSNAWHFDREMLLNGGDFGGDIAIVVDEYETVIGLTDHHTEIVTPIVFDTLAIRAFIKDATLGVDLPHMRECEVDNFIVAFHTWNEGLV